MKMKMTFNIGLMKSGKTWRDDNMGNEKIDYRVIGLKADTFDEFYLKLKGLCDRYNIHMSGVIHREDVMTYEK